MRLISLLGVLLLLAGGLAACGGGGESEQPPESKPMPVVLHGYAVFAHEVRTFQPCGVDSVLWAVDSTQVLWDLYRELVPPTAPDQGLFAVVEGLVEPALAEGFGAEYPGTLQVKRVIYLGLEGPDCSLDWDAFRFRAQGNEPFWSVVIDAAGMRLKRPSSPDLLWPAVTREEYGDQLRFVGARGEEIDTVVLVIRAEPGRDTMSGSYYGLSAELQLGDETYQGRALAGTGR